MIVRFGAATRVGALFLTAVLLAGCPAPHRSTRVRPLPIETKEPEPDFTLEEPFTSLVRVGVRDGAERVSIALTEPVRALGKYEVDVRIGGDVTAKLKFWVVGKEKAE